MITRKAISITIIWFITMIPCMYYIVSQVRENMIIDKYLEFHDLTNLSISKESAVRISDDIRSNFNIKQSTFTALNLNNRPFLREDAGHLLTIREGLCGEGTRVIVNLLQRLGYDATRVTLYNKHLQSAHTLVSVKIGEKEFFVDSINSLKAVNQSLRDNDVSAMNFNVLHYTDNLSKRRLFKSTESNNDFFDYWLYSYEALPYTKLITRMGLDVRIFNFQRPRLIFSSLAEKPNLIMALVSFLLSLLVVLITYLVSLYWTKSRKNNRKSS